MIDFRAIENRWQKKWEQENAFAAEADEREKYYVAIVYPYMSGLLHLGHLFTYTIPEIMMRYKRMRGFNVLAKFGFHCTGTPIVAAAQKVKENEPQQLAAMKKMGIAEKELSKFADPKHWIDYFPQETLKDIKAMGFSIDERYTFRTTYLNPAYDAFIRWQFNRLHEKGYVKKGKHPVIWCPKDNLPVGDHDRSEGEGETPQEFLLFKHRLDDGRFVISATLRHDTVLGITNLFVGPDITYCEAVVDGEMWILGEKAANALKNQGHTVRITGKIPGKELICKKTLEFDGSKVLILPASFLDPDFGTGLVHSVPSDSADDLIALRDLQHDAPLCKKYRLNADEVRAIKPIPVLNTPEYGDIAAEAMLKKYGIKSQNEKSKLEAVKKELYRLSHYTATFNEKYKGAFSENLHGRKVAEGKDIIKNDLIAKGFAAMYYEPTGKIVCRCLTECVVRIVDDQWFIQYDNQEWKKSAHECLAGMKIYPEKIRKQFEYVIDWLEHWACTREYGLGTKLPWDDKWVIESLSDSTLQMAYGTIAKYLEHPDRYGFSVEKINDEFFDYVFLGEGDAENTEASAGIPKKMIEAMKNDFSYWYPFDFRNSAKDLMQNHLAFCIFNHTALFPKKHWPKAYVINGRIMVNNEKMSKSKGNFFTMRELYEKHGADVTRITAANAGEGIEDANYDMTFLETASKKLTELHDFISSSYGNGRSKKLQIDIWFESSVHEAIQKTTDALEHMLFKSAVQYSFLDMHRNLKWYLKRTNGNPHKDSIRFFIETQITLLAPIIPHFCEECWDLIGKKGFVSLAEWPAADSSKVKPVLSYGEELVRNTMHDIREVLRLAKVEKPKAIYLFTAPSWKYTLFKKVHGLLEETQHPGEILKKVIEHEELRKHGKAIAKFLPKMISSRKIPSVLLACEDELKTIEEAADFLKTEYGCKIMVSNAEKSAEQKAQQATPGKVAILVE